MRELARRHPVTAFCLLAFLLSWATAAPFAMRSRGLIAFEASEVLESAVAFGPAIAAFVVLWLGEGKQGVAQLWRSICAWRIGTVAFFMAVVVPILLLVVAWTVARTLGGEAPAIRPGVEFGTAHWVVALFAAALSGPGEEPGWRGVALRKLQVGRSALRATVIVAVWWWVWHLPMFLYRVDVNVVQVLLFFVGLLAGSIWASCVYNAAGGSVFAAILWHSAWNIVSATGRAFEPTVFLTMTSGVMLLAILIVTLWGPARLAPAPRPAPQLA